jgi:hypothetical protein
VTYVSGGLRCNIPWPKARTAGREDDIGFYLIGKVYKSFFNTSVFIGYDFVLTNFKFIIAEQVLDSLPTYVFPFLL